MTSTIIDGVCKSLAEEFGSEYRIYTESVEQGFKEPCFFVSAISVEVTPILCKGVGGGRYNRKQGVNVVFYPDKNEGDVRNKVYSVAERVMDVLEYIEADGTTRGTGIACEFAGDSPEMIASVNVDYEFTIRKVKTEDETLMEELKQELKVETV